MINVFIWILTFLNQKKLFFVIDSRLNLIEFLVIIYNKYGTIRFVLIEWHIKHTILIRNENFENSTLNKKLLTYKIKQNKKFCSHRFLANIIGNRLKLLKIRLDSIFHRFFTKNHFFGLKKLKTI